MNDEIKTKIKELYETTPDYVHGVKVGYKIKNGQKTNQLSIVFHVLEKKSINDIPQDELLPSSIQFSDGLLITDVVESKKAYMMTCYTNTSATPSTSYDSTDTNVARLRGRTTPALFPMRGGQEIIQYPTEWTPVAGSFSISVGTIGFYCIDNVDGRIVGVTNSHVLIYNRLFGSERILSNETTDAYNIYEQRSWVYDGSLRYPGAVIADGANPIKIAGRLKRYYPVSESGTNYIDTAILIPEATLIDANSYKIWGVIGNPDYSPFMPFATTGEIDNLLVSQPYLYSTGRTTGPKGFGPTASCRLVVTGTGVSQTVAGTINGTEGDTDWADLVSYEYDDGSPWPAAGGDSGSAVVADFSGTRKIIGLLFAGNATTALMCRIDRVASDLNIRAWDGSFNVSAPTSYAVATTASSVTASSATLSYGGRTYYQAGLTNLNSYTPVP